MSHAFDMINRIRMNRQQQQKSNPYKSFDQSIKTGKRKKYTLKAPTGKELETIRLSNETYFTKQRKAKRKGWIVVTIIGFILLYYFVRMLN